jgi:spore germination protein
MIELKFKDCGDLVRRKFPVGEDRNIEVCVFYIDMMASRDVVEGSIIKNLMIFARNAPPKFDELKPDAYMGIKDGVVTTAEIEDESDLDKLCDALLCGDTVILVDGFAKGYVVSTKGYPNRGVSAAESEVALQGPKDSFNELFRVNSALIRRRIRDTNLKLIQKRVGLRSKTDIGIMYLEDVARPDVVRMVTERIDNINIDASLDCGYIEQLIEDDWLSPFPQIQTTERPDKTASAILEGRVAIISDNSPQALLLPSTFGVFFQASDDYYQRWGIMTFTRALRYAAGCVALAMPALYLAAAVFHPSMLPMPLTFKMAEARRTTPLPAMFEVIIMDLAFELIREAGIRLPNVIGSAIGIVGGIIIGQAAVEAGLVSPIVVIIVALTAICSFAIPSVSLVNGYRLSKYWLVLLAGCFGLFGFWLGVLTLLIHLVSLKSFGIPYMFPFSSGELNGYDDIKDSVIRVPLFMMKKRPLFARPGGEMRLNPPETGNPHVKE